MILSSLFKKQYRHLNKILINQSALQLNHQVLQVFHPEAKIVPVLKSNAYGHGLKTVTPIFDALGPEFLVVDSLYEAYELYKMNVKSKILILGYTHPDNFLTKQLPFHITIFDLETAKALNKQQKNCNVHIFVDTGMCREGVSIKHLPEFIQEVKKLSCLHIVGLTSHLADADNPKDGSFTEKQIANYKKALKITEDAGISLQYRQISASGGAFKIKDPTFNVIRAGLASYGINPLELSDPEYQSLSLQPALQFVTTLAQIKTIQKGEKIGYNGTFTAQKTMTVGLLPLGYYEGVDRRLSNKGVVTINDIVCPIVGRVSMNMTSIDLSAVKNAEVGDAVCIYSDENQENSIVNAAKIAGTIPYELLVHLSESVRREIINK
jgi:alanine racemase